MKHVKLPDKLLKTFCMAPWVHIQQNSYGEVNPCCMFLPDKTPYEDFKTKYNSLQKAFDGVDNKKLRERMLAGEYIEGCNKCYVEEEEDGSREGAIKYSFRNHFNDLYYNEYNILNPAIRDIEFSLGNKCNYKCLTCNTRFSSAWYADDISTGNVVDTYKGRTVKNSLPDINLTELKELKVLGGETFLDNLYLELFKMINCEEINLTLYTNNSVFPKQEWLDYFNRFKRVKLNISIDGVYDVGEFVRLGMKFSRFEKNLKKWILFSSKYNNTTLVPHYVFHNLNSLNLNKTLVWLRNINGWDDVNKRISYTFLYGPERLNPAFLPNETKKIIIDNNNNNFLTDKLKKFLLTHETDDTLCNDFIKYVDFLTLRKPLPEECSIIYDSVKKHNERK